MEDLPMKPQPVPQTQTHAPQKQRVPKHLERYERQFGVTHVPQLSTAKRRLNQQGQPRTGEGQYANKPESKWRQAMSGQQPIAPTSLKRQKTPARPGTTRQPLLRLAAKKRARPLPSMEAMMDRPLHHKVGYVVRRWFRRKKQHLRALFSLRG